MTLYTPFRNRFVSFLVAAAGVGGFSASADTVVGTTSAGAKPVAAAANPVTNQIFVPNYDSNSVTVIDAASNSVAAVPVGTNPVAVAVNPVTNKIYVANYSSNNVTIIDGATRATTTVGTGVAPYDLAVNPLTNMIYVANYTGDSVTVINGSTHATSTVNTGTTPVALAVNPVTNLVYVANYNSNNVTVINGAGNTASTVSVGTNPVAVGVNPITNAIYVANQGSATVTLIDGVTNTTAAVDVGTNPFALAVNPVTNQIFVANDNASGTVTLIDGANKNTTTVVYTGSRPSGVAVNPVTNKVYVTDYGSNQVTLIDIANFVVYTVNVGLNPFGLTINPVTNKIYVANFSSGNVTVLDGTTNDTATANTGAAPNGIVVNPVTDKIYATNGNSASVTVIDGADGSTTTVNAGAGASAPALNPLTNMVYVANPSAGTITAINGADNSASTVGSGFSVHPTAISVDPVTNMVYVVDAAAGGVIAINGVNDDASIINAGANSSQFGIAVNPATSRVYVPNSGDNSVTVIDGSTNTRSTVGVGANPGPVAVNPATNKVYVVSTGGNSVTVVDGATNATATVSVGANPVAIAVNSATNTIYVANENASGTVTVINGAANTTSTVNVGVNPIALTVNSATNKIYVANNSDGSVSVIDGATNTPFSVAVGSSPKAVTVNPVTGLVYVANNTSNDVTIITPAPASPVAAALFTSITPLAGNVTYTATPAFSFQAASLYKPAEPSPDAIFYQVDTMTGPWQRLVPSNGAANAALATGLNYGPHTIYAFATDGQEAARDLGGTSPITGAVTAYSFVYGDAAPVASAQAVTVVKGASIPITLAGAGQSPLKYSVTTQPAYGLLSGIAPNLVYSTNNASYIGSDSFTFTVSDGVQTSPPATISIQIVDDVPVADNQSLGTTREAPLAVTLTGSALDPLTYRIVTLPANGVLSGTMPQLTYTPNVGFVGNDTFTFEVNDGFQNSAPATVTIAVVETGTPLAVAQSVTVERGAQIGITLAGSSNFPLTYMVATPTTYGSLIGTAPNLTYNASASFAGTDSFTFTVSDGVKTSPPATVNITILDSPPVAVDDVFYTASDARQRLTLDVLANDSDPEGRPLTITAVSRASEGAVTIAADGQSLLYRPEVRFAKSGQLDTFTYTVSNGDKTATAEVTVANPFNHHQGRYDGLVINGMQDAGYLTLALRSGGGFTGALHLNGLNSPFHGSFSSGGLASLKIHRGDLRPAVTLQLQFDDATGDTITVGATDGTAAYAGVLKPQVAVSKQNPLAQAGRYTAIIPAPNPSANNLPGGNGVAAVEVAVTGRVRLKGVLGDGTPFTCSCYLEAGGTFPIYVALDRKRKPGSLWGLAAFQDVPDVSDFSAALQWNRAAQHGDSRYHAGFSTQVGLFGSHYLFGEGRQALTFSNSSNGRAEIDFSGGNLASQLQMSADVTDGNRVEITHSNREHLKLKVAKKDGLITGRFDFSFPPKSASHVTGVIFQKQNLAEGLFIGPTLTGTFTLAPQ